MAEVVDDERGGREDDPIGAQATHNDGTLEFGAAVFPLAGQPRSRRLGLRVAVPDEGCNQRASEAIRCNQRHSEAVRWP